jgi:uncharacterized protein (DUF608 family)
MIYESISKLEMVSPGDTVKLKQSKKGYVSQLFEHSKKIGCKLILLKYGEYFFKDEREIYREKYINEILGENV